MAGGDCIDDADVLRTGGTAGAIGCVLKAPSTLGTFLRSFRWGHVRQLDRVSRELPVTSAATEAKERGLAALRWPIADDAAAAHLDNTVSYARLIEAYTRDGLDGDPLLDGRCSRCGRPPRRRGHRMPGQSKARGSGHPLVLKSSSPSSVPYSARRRIGLGQQYHQDPPDFTVHLPQHWPWETQFSAPSLGCAPCHLLPDGA